MKSNHKYILIIIFSCAFAVLIFALGLAKRNHARRLQLSPPAGSETVSEAQLKRQKFAGGLTHSTNPVSEVGNVTFDVAGSNDTTLTMTGDFLEQRDCQSFYTSNFARAAELAGFRLLRCRNRNTGEVWDVQLQPNSYEQ